MEKQMWETPRLRQLSGTRNSLGGGSMIGLRVATADVSIVTAMTQYADASDASSMYVLA